MPSNLFLSTRQASALFGRSRSTMTEYCRLGYVPGAIKKNGRWLIPVDVSCIRVGDFEVIFARGWGNNGGLEI